MRTLIASALVVSAMALAPVANAATGAANAITGTIKAVSSTQLTLANGDIFMLPKTFKNPGLKAGEKVKVAFVKMGKKLEAESVTIVK